MTTSKSDRVGIKRTPEYHPIVQIGRGFVVAGLFLSSCRGIFGKSDSVLSESTQPRSTEIVPTPFLPTPTNGLFQGTSETDQILAVFGGAVGFGGLGTKEDLSNSSFIQGLLNKNGLAPIIDGQGRLSQVFTHSNSEIRLCVPNLPEKLFNPAVIPHEDSWIKADKGIVSYGDGVTKEVRFQALSAISLNGLADNLTCINVVVVGVDRTEKLGTLLTLLIDSKTGEIFGTLPAVYNTEDRVKFNSQTAEVIVNGEAVWFAGDNMVKLAEQLLPTDAVFAERLLAECPVKLEIANNLRGPVLIGGAESDLPPQNIPVNITFALDSSVINRGRESELLPYDRLKINQDFANETGIDPQAQIVADLWFGHYSAWQHDQDDKYWSLRQSTSFNDYITMVNSGGDGSHRLWAITTEGKIYPNEQIIIDPIKTKMIYIFDNGWGESGVSGIIYDKARNALIFKISLGLKWYDPESFVVKSAPYYAFWLYLAHMSTPSSVQKLGYNTSDNWNKLQARERIFQNYRLNYERIYSVPLIGNSPGFK